MNFFTFNQEETSLSCLLPQFKILSINTPRPLLEKLRINIEMPSISILISVPSSIQTILNSIYLFIYLSEVLLGGDGPLFYRRNVDPELPLLTSYAVRPLAGKAR